MCLYVLSWPAAVPPAKGCPWLTCASRHHKQLQCHCPPAQVKPTVCLATPWARRAWRSTKRSIRGIHPWSAEIHSTDRSIKRSGEKPGCSQKDSGLFSCPRVSGVAHKACLARRANTDGTVVRQVCTTTPDQPCEQLLRRKALGRRGPLPALTGITVEVIFDQLHHVVSYGLVSAQEQDLRRAQTGRPARRPVRLLAQQPSDAFTLRARMADQAAYRDDSNANSTLRSNTA